MLVEVDERAGTAIARSYWVLLVAGRSLLAGIHGSPPLAPVSTSPDEPIRPILAGRYHDRFALVGGTWRFTERAYLVDLTGSESAALLGGG